MTYHRSQKTKVRGGYYASDSLWIGSQTKYDHIDLRFLQITISAAWRNDQYFMKSNYLKCLPLPSANAVKIQVREEIKFIGLFFAYKLSNLKTETPLEMRNYRDEKQK